MAYEKKRLFPVKEKAFLLKFMERLKVCARHDMWYFKTHGEPMQVRGVPDVLGVYYGIWLSIEFKVMRKGKLLLTPYQEYTGELLQKANALHLVVWYDEDNGECGIGVIRFPTISEAVDWLVDGLESAICVSCVDRAGFKK